MFKYKITGLLILICSMNCLSQSSIWYFGNNGGLKFNSDGTTSPQPGSAMVTNEGCATVIDVNGNALFYSDGKKIWHGESHSLITSSLLGSPSATQSSVIVPLSGIGSDSKFIIFTSEGVETTPTVPNGIGVALVTVTGVAPNHIISVSPAVSINSDGQTFSEKLSVTNDGNGGWWVVAHNYTLSNSGGDTFYKYHVLNSSAFNNSMSSTEISTALNNNVTTQTIGSNHSGGVYNAQGQMKFSKDGLKLGLVLAGSKKAEIFLFNQSTGELNLDKSISIPGNNTYGFEFSADGQKIFVAQDFGNYGSISNLYQYDLSVTPPTQFTIATETCEISTSRYPFNCLQLGPDNRVYLAGPHIGNTSLSVINEPNIFGASCGYNALSVPISGTTAYGLPTVTLSRVSNQSNGIVENLSEVTQKNGDQLLKVYPNPNNGSFFINTAEIGTGCKYQIISLEGREIETGVIQGDFQEITTSEITPGIYSVNIFLENRVFTEKIVVFKF